MHGAGRLGDVDTDDQGAVAAQGANLRPLEQQRQAELALGEFLPGDSELAVQANLQTTLTGLAQASGVRIRSARKLPERERAPFKLVGMGLNLTTDIANVQKILYAIETARPYLFVESLDISPLGGANPPPGQRMLEVRLDVFAAPQRRELPEARSDLAAPQRREPEGRPDIFAVPQRREQP